jgi:hypothetical protein
MPAFQIRTLPPPSLLYDVVARRAAAKQNLPTVMFSPDPTLTPKLMSMSEIDAWLEHRYSAGIFGRDLDAETVYTDTEIVAETEDTPPVIQVDDEYTDTEEVE